MRGTEIRQLGPRDASEYQAIFLEALRSAPEAFAADYEQESAHGLEEVVERFQQEGIYGGFVSGRVASREVDQVDLYVAVENERAWRFY